MIEIGSVWKPKEADLNIKVVERYEGEGFLSPTLRLNKMFKGWDIISEKEFINLFEPVDVKNKEFIFVEDVYGKKYFIPLSYKDMWDMWCYEDDMVVACEGFVPSYATPLDDEIYVVNIVRKL